MFFWSASTSSKVYHKDGCTSIKVIRPENLRSGTTPPPNRTLHGCTIPAPVSGSLTALGHTNVS